MILSNIEVFVGAFYKSVRFRYHLKRERKKYGKFDFSYKSTLEPTSVIILANGPSLKDDLENIKERAKKTGALLYAVNDFAMTDLFPKMQPPVYCFIDRLYFREEAREYRIYEYLNSRVKWNMLLYIPLDKYKFVKERINNTKINIVPISTLQFEGFEKKKYEFYKKGIAVPSFVNVVNLAIYSSLNSGVKKIYLYGVDHTFLKLIFVDENNVLCLRDEHFYGSEIIHIPPKNDGSFWKVSDFVYDKYLTFKEHDNLRGYADFLGAQIINCTQCSCIDSYVRLSQIEENNN